MARTRQLSQLVSDVRVRADLEGVTARFPDEQIAEFINQSIARLFSMLDQYDATYYRSQYIIITENGAKAYELPKDFWVAKKVSASIGGRKFTLDNYNPAEADWLDDYGVWGNGYPLHYRLAGDNIEFSPIPSGNYTIILDYAQAPPRLSLNEFFDGKIGFEEWVILDAAIKTRRKNNKDAGDLQQDKADVQAWIESVAGTRDRANPERVADTQSCMGDGNWGDW